MAIHPFILAIIGYACLGLAAILSVWLLVVLAIRLVALVFVSLMSWLGVNPQRGSPYSIGGDRWAVDVMGESFTLGGSYTPRALCCWFFDHPDYAPKRWVRAHPLLAIELLCAQRRTRREAT